MQTHLAPTRRSRRRRILAVLAAFVVAAVLGTIGAATRTDPRQGADLPPADAAGRGGHATSTNAPTWSSSSSTSSTSTTSTTLTPLPGGAAAEAGGPGGPAPSPARLVAPLAPLVLPVGVDSGTFEIANTGDRVLHLTSVAHPGYLSTDHDSPMPDTIPPRTVIEVQFGSFAPYYNGGVPGPWERVIDVESDGGDAEIVVRGTAPVPGDLIVPVVSPPVPYPQGSSFWIEQSGPFATTVEVSVGPGLVLNTEPSFTMGVSAQTVVGFSPCGRPAAAVDKVIMRKVFFEVLGHGTYETQVFFEIEAGPAEPCIAQVV